MKLMVFQKRARDFRTFLLSDCLERQLPAYLNQMNYDEFAFFNQQLASMLREGLPLEGALKELAQGISDGRLRSEIDQLGADLSRGTPLKEALAHRRLPALYSRMLEIGIRSNDLPGVLTMLADHYHRTNALWTRLKGLLVYPLIVVVVSLGLTIVLSVILTHFLTLFPEQFGSAHTLAFASLWMPPIVLIVIALASILAVSRPELRQMLRWRLPAFREASLAQLASAISLMLKNGTTLPDALALAESLEGNSPAGRTLAEWGWLSQTGMGKPADWKAKAFPPLFLWLVRSAGENVASGFHKAAELYQARAAYKTDLALYGALPVSIVFVGQLVFWQVAPLIRAFTTMINSLGG
jgi:type II secretory pathway component PulF